MPRRTRTALTESAAPVTEAMSLNHRVEMVSAALRQRFGDYGNDASYDDIPRCQDVFEGNVVFMRKGKMWSLDYTEAEHGGITLSDQAPKEVHAEVEYVPVTEAAVLGAPAKEKAGELAGIVWEVTLISAGDSANGRHYPADVLKKAAPLFEGVKAYADHPGRSESRERPERSVRDVIGWFEGVKYDAKAKALTAHLHLSEAAGSLRQLVLDAWNRGKKDLIGLSINAEGQIQESIDGGKRKKTVTSISRVSSVDLVTEPAAGGRLEKLVASTRPDDTQKDTAMDPEEIKKIIGAALAEALGPVQAELAAVKALAESNGTPAPAAAEKPAEKIEEAEKPDANAVALAEVRREMFDVRLASAVTESKLPEPSQARVRKLFEARIGTTEEVTAAIREEREFIASLVKTPMVQFGRVHQGEGGSVGDDERTKFLKRFEGFYAGSDVDGVPAFRNLREAYGVYMELREGRPISFYELNPTDIWRTMHRNRASLNRTAGTYLAESRRRSMPLLEAIDDRVLRESLVTGDWTDVFGDVQYKALIREYNGLEAEFNWRKFVSDVESVPDFQTKHWTRIGGFADLSSVSQGATYPNMTSPGDEEVEYAVGKFGGLHDVTEETIVNDVVGAIRRIPGAMARAARRTLYKDVMDLITTDNPTMDYDSVALYNNAHGNTGTTALSVAGLAAVVQLMRDQSAYGESAQLLGGINKPRHIIVPNELEQRAKRILMPSDAYQFALSSTPDADTSIDPQHFKDAGIEFTVYDYSTNAKDWWTVADPAKVPTLVVGFLNGRQEPELLVQDSPTTGSVFTADKITTKVRTVYGMDILDHRSFYYQDVA